MYPLQGLPVMSFQPQRLAIKQSGGATNLQLLLILLTSSRYTRVTWFQRSSWFISSYASDNPFPDNDYIGRCWLVFTSDCGLHDLYGEMLICLWLAYWLCKWLHRTPDTVFIVPCKLQKPLSLNSKVKINKRFLSARLQMLLLHPFPYQRA